jgi:hypothetical protein
MGDSSNPDERRRRPWLKWTGVTLLILLVLLAVFHRPIVFSVTRYFLVRAARQQNLDIDYKMGGSIFTTLTVSHLKATPTEPGPIQRLEIERIYLRYSLYGWMRKGAHALLHSVEMKNAFVEITPREKLPPEKAKEKQQVKFPALFPRELLLENVSFISHNPEGDLRLEGLTLTLHPDRDGQFKINVLAIPKFRTWKNLGAKTTFVDRRLQLQNLRLDPEVELEIFELDASGLAANELGLVFQGDMFGSTGRIEAEIKDLNAANQLTLQLRLAGLQLGRVGEYFETKLPLGGNLEMLHLDLAGRIDNPRTWTGSAVVRAVPLSMGSVHLDRGEFRMETKEGRATMLANADLGAANSIRFQSTLAWPDALDKLKELAAEGSFDMDARDLAAIVALEKVSASGNARLSGKFAIENQRLLLDADARSNDLRVSGNTATDAAFTLHFERNLNQEPGAAFYDSLVAKAEGSAASVTAGGYTADDVQYSVRVNGAQVSMEKLSAKKGTNTLEVHGDYVLPSRVSEWRDQPLDLNVDLHAPDLAQFVAEGSGMKLAGALDIKGQAAMKDGVYEGSFEITGHGVNIRGVPVARVDARVSIQKDQALLDPVDVVFDADNRIHARGSLNLKRPYAYAGEANVALDDLQVFRPALGGRLKLTWSGKGERENFNHTGHASVALSDFTYRNLRNLNVSFTSEYSPQEIHVPDVRASIGEAGDASFSILWKDNRLNVSDLIVRQQSRTAVRGNISVPLHLRDGGSLEQRIPDNEPLEIALQTSRLEIARTAAGFGHTDLPVSGVVQMDFNANGTLDELKAALTLRAENLKSAYYSDLRPARVELAAALANDRLAVSGTVRQPLIQPLQVKAEMPFDAAEFRSTRTIDKNAPIAGSLLLPSSSIAFLSELFPEIRQVQGVAAANVQLEGTIAAPRFSGHAESRVETLRMKDLGIPPLNKVTIVLDFAEDVLKISRLQGSTGGGTFSGEGTIGFADLSDIQLDVVMHGNNILVYQNDDLTVRLSPDLRIAGPLNAAAVTGNVLITRSRFLKNIDILPIGLPGRPAPEPPREARNVSLPNPPLRDWTFDVGIKTADPFLVEGNLAKGRVIADLRLGGTGLEPWFDGTVKVQELVASLPFSRLRVRSGYVYFSQDAPFRPRLNLTGRSTIRDYDVRVHVYGLASAPEAVFSSDPPLPQSDIVSLLATGTTRDELSKDPNALAGRAAMLVLQKLYRSVFKDGDPVDTEETFLSRLELDVSGADPKTGNQSVAARARVTDRIVLVGGVDVGGNVSSQLKYVIRFR